MTLKKKLDTGTVIAAYNHEEGNTVGQTISAKNGSTGCYEPLVHIESVKCAEGTMNRLVIKRSTAEKLGWLIIEE